MRKLDFVSLQVRDLEASKDFYTNLLGFEIIDRNPQAYIFKHGQNETVFAIRTPLTNLEGKVLGIGASYWFAIDDTAETAKQIFIKNGVTTTSSITDTPFGKAFHLTDLDGYTLTFVSSKQ